MSDTTLPACITRDNLTSDWFPNTSRATLHAIVALCAVFLLTSFNRLNHTDLWGHLNFGRWMVENRALPTSDPFSAQPAETPVLHAAWLAQLVGYEVQTTFGNEGLVFGHALLVTLAAAALMLAVAARGAPASLLWASAAAMFVLDLPIVGTARPQLFGQLGAALVLLGCAQLEKRWSPLVWLPLVFLAWANLHGSFIIGLGILAIFAAGRIWNAYVAAQSDLTAICRDRQVQATLLALLLSLAAACVNPQGATLLVAAAQFGENPVLGQISEWRSLTPNSLTGVLMMLSAAATVGLYKYSRRKWEAYELLLLVVFGLATLSAIRMLAWWALVWPFVALPHLAAVWEQHRAKAPAAEADTPRAMTTLIALGFVFLTLVVAPPTYSMVSGRVRGEGPIVVTDTPLYITDEVVRRELTGHFAAPLDWSDYVIWKTAARMKPLVYGHVHLADAATWDDYLQIFAGGEGWLKTCQAREIRYLLVSKSVNRELMKRVLVEDRGGSGRVRILYQDQKSLLAEVLATASPTKAAANGG